MKELIADNKHFRRSKTVLVNTSQRVHAVAVPQKHGDGLTVAYISVELAMVMAEVGQRCVLGIRATATRE